VHWEGIYLSLCMDVIPKSNASFLAQKVMGVAHLVGKHNQSNTPLPLIIQAIGVSHLEGTLKGKDPLRDVDKICPQKSNKQALCCTCHQNLFDFVHGFLIFPR
jgi:hypothetical protein